LIDMHPMKHKTTEPISYLALEPDHPWLRLPPAPNTYRLGFLLVPNATCRFPHASFEDTIRNALAEMGGPAEVLLGVHSHGQLRPSARDGWVCIDGESGESAARIAMSEYGEIIVSARMRFDSSIEPEGGIPIEAVREVASLFAALAPVLWRSFRPSASSGFVSAEMLDVGGCVLVPPSLPVPGSVYRRVRAAEITTGRFEWDLIHEPGDAIDDCLIELASAFRWDLNGVGGDVSLSR
jgi:hypothetical protein